MFVPRRLLLVSLATLGAGFVAAGFWALLQGTGSNAAGSQGTGIGAFYGLAAGGLIALLPGLGVMLPLARRLAAGQAVGLRRLLYWESAKWLLTAMLFSAVFVWPPPHTAPVWLFAGFVLGQGGLSAGLMAMAQGDSGKL